MKFWTKLHINNGTSGEIGPVAHRVNANIRLILAASVLIPFSHLMFYVWNTAGNTVLRDDIYLIKGAVVERFCAGTLTFADLWRPTSGSRILGYNLLLLANVLWGGLNSRLIVLLIPFVLVATAFLLFRDYSKSLAGICSPARTAYAFFLPMLLLFSLIMWEAFSFDYAIIFVWPIPWFLAAFYALEHLLVKGGWRSWLFAIVSFGLAVLVFGASSSFAFGTALGITFGIRFILDRQNFSRVFLSRALGSAAILGLFLFLYSYHIRENDYFPATQYMDLRVFAHPFDTVRFVLASLAGSVIGVDSSKASLSSSAIFGVGLLVALAYVWALVLFFRTRMHERTYLPLFLVLYTLSFVAFMTVGRFQYGLLYGMASRYTCSTICGIIAIVWIISFAVAKEGRTSWLLRNAGADVIFLLFLGMIWTTAAEWKIQPYRRGYSQRLREIALRVDTASDMELAYFEEAPGRVRDSLLVLKRFGLNVYRTGQIPLLTNTKLPLRARSACSILLSPTSEYTQTGYATLECDTSTRLTGTSVLSLVQNGVVVSESGVPTAQPTKAARVFIDYCSVAAIGDFRAVTDPVSINTGLAIANCGHTAAHVTYTLRDRMGNILANGQGIVTAGSHFTKFVDRLEEVAVGLKMPVDVPEGIQMGSLDVVADQPLAIGAYRQSTNRRNERIETSALVADLVQTPNNSPAYFPQLADGGGYATSIHLMNTSRAIEVGTLRFFDGSGAPLTVTQSGGRSGSEHRYSIPSGGIFSFQSDGSQAAKVGWILLTPDPGTATPVGKGVISSSSKGILVTECDVPATAPSTHVRVSVDRLGRYGTALAIANALESDVSISMEAFQSDGTAEAAAGHNMLRMTGRAHSAKFVSDLIPGLKSGFNGVLDIRSATPFVALALRTLRNTRGDLLYTTLSIADLDRTVSPLLVFPRIADGGEYRAELILTNTGTEGTAILKSPLAVIPQTGH